MAILILPALLQAAGQGVRLVDFQNFEYPFQESFVPSGWNWLTTISPQRVRLVHGRANFDRADPHGAYLELISVNYGDLDRDGEDEAVVDLLYSTGGTANWHYLYIFKASNHAATLIAVLESGSRADGGLIGSKISHGLLVLDFADADRREGDCCSRGIIRVEYRLKDGRFHETGPRQKDSIRFVNGPAYQAGPQTVNTSVDGQNVNIVYTDAKGVTRPLTSSGVNVEPNLSPDGNLVVFLRKLNAGESEIWTIGTGGKDLRRIFHGPVHWNGRTYPSSSLRSPKWSADAHSIYFVTDFSLTKGALWCLDLTSQEAKAIIPEAVNFGVIQSGRYRGYLVANQRSEGASYPVYPFLLYTPAGRRVQQIGEETDDLEQLVSDWEHR